MFRFSSRSAGDLPRFQKRLRRRVRRVRVSSTQRSRAHVSSYFSLTSLGVAPRDIASTDAPDVADSVSACAQHDSVASDVGDQQGNPAPAVDSKGLADVLPYLLSSARHFDLDIHDVCSILCCCSEYADIVEHHCSGSLVVELLDPYGTAAMDSFATWLPGHGGALQSLVVGDLSKASLFHDCPVFLSLAMPMIAASCLGWKLQQYISTSPNSSAPIILEQLPCSHLTNLQITLPDDSQCPEVSRAFSIIGQLSKLARLQIASDHPAVEQSDSGCVVSLSPFSSLKHLTALQLDNVVSFSGLGELQHLPPSIQKLHISCPACTGHHDEQLVLDHLTALHSLSLDSSDCYCLSAEDSLPASLRSVWIGYCDQLQPLLRLTELQEMSLTNTPQTELAQVTALTTLTKLALTYDSPMPELYIDVWVDLAMLREVTLIGCLIDPPELQLIGQTQGLTKLCMVFCTYESTVQELVLALKKLTNLQELVLDSNNPDPADEKYGANICPPYGLDWPRNLTELRDEANATDAPSLLLECLSELANRHKLRSLHLDMSCGQPEEYAEVLVSSNSCLKLACGKYAAMLAGATALTRLSIGGEIMSAFMGVGTYVSLLTNLCSLQFVDDVGLSDTALGLLAQSLTNLTHLDISRSTEGTTAAGLGVLTGLKQLRSLGVGAAVTPSLLRRMGLPTSCECEMAWYGAPGKGVGSTSGCRLAPPW